jgi:hypothetical protein
MGHKPEYTPRTRIVRERQLHRQSVSRSGTGFVKTETRRFKLGSSASPFALSCEQPSPDGLRHRGRQADIRSRQLQPDACKSPVGLRGAYGAGSGTKDVRGHLRPPTPSLLGNGLRFQIVSASHMSCGLLAARALPGSVLNWMCAGLTNPNLAPREHMSLVAMRPMLFGVAAFAACCAGCATHKNDQTSEIERTAGDYCQSKGQNL